MNGWQFAALAAVLIVVALNGLYVVTIVSDEPNFQTLAIVMSFFTGTMALAGTIVGFIFGRASRR